MSDRNDTQQLPVEEILKAAEEAAPDDNGRQFYDQDLEDTLIPEQENEQEPVPVIVEDDDNELENPFEPDGHKKKQRGEKRITARKKPSEAKQEDGAVPTEEKEHTLGKTLKRWAIAFVVIVGAALIIYGAAMLMHRRNDGARYAKELAAAISRPLSEAQSEAGITLKSGSDNAVLAQVFPEFVNMAESKKNCKIMGVKLPQWAIVCHTEGDQLSEVTYYDYTVLQKNPLGTVCKSYIEPTTLTGPLTVEEFSEQLGLEPFSVTYLKDQTVQRSYRYCYKDPQTEGLVSYTISAVWNMAGQLSGVQDTRTNYVSMLLADENN